MSYHQIKFEDTDEERSSSSLLASDSSTIVKHSRTKWLFSAASRSHVVLAVISALLLGISFFTGAWISAPTDSICIRRLSTYSPMLEAVKYDDVFFNNEFRKESIYRGTPTPELEEAWNRLWTFPSMNVPEAEFATLNYSADFDWRHTPAAYGGGVEAQAEVFHQIHCLNMIRQYTYLDHYDVPPEGFRKGPEMSRTHVDHCIETLRIQLMCTGDVTIVPVRIDEESPLGAQAVFSTRHKCRNYQKLVEWMVENGISE